MPNRPADGDHDFQTRHHRANDELYAAPVARLRPKRRLSVLCGLCGEAMRMGSAEISTAQEAGSAAIIGVFGLAEFFDLVCLKYPGAFRTGARWGCLVDNVRVNRGCLVSHRV